MDETLATKEKKKRAVKDIILQLHDGLSVAEAKDKFVREVGTITSTEIAEIEQSLINDGLSPEEIKRFCNVHALLFESALKDVALKEESPAHPVYLFKQENRKIETIMTDLKEKTKNINPANFTERKTKIFNVLSILKGIDIHYVRKEQVLFPYLEKYGFYGPSKVMWGKHNEIRDLLKKSLTEITKLDSLNQLDNYLNTTLNLFISEVEGMVFKEENILFPTSLEKLQIDDWVEILKQGEDIGYVFIDKPKDTSTLINELKRSVVEEAKVEGTETVSFPTGKLNLPELLGILNTLPVDITFVDKDDTVKYFSEGKDRIFIRTKAVIGRKVQNCHPPQSVDVVENILTSFKSGRKDYVNFWINFRGKLVYIRYFAVRNVQGEYLGTLEVTQDITEIRSLQGEKRLVDERA